MKPASATSAIAATPREPWAVGHAPPGLELPPLTRAELDARIRGGEWEADECERILASAARARGAIDVALAEGLDALRKGDRLARLACHLDDYAREALDLGRRTAEGLARLGAALRTRPLLGEALRSGRVRLRAAQAVLPVAVGEAEALWVERAATQTVRELEEGVRRARAPDEDADDGWWRVRTHLPAREATVLDAGLELARELMPGSTRIQQLEALAQEYLGELSAGEDEEERCPMGRPADAPGRRAREAAARAEPEQWAMLPPVAEWPVPDVRFYETATAQDLDSRLRELARLRAGWDELVGYCAHVVRRSGLWWLRGFTSFRHYVEERLQLPPRAVEQRERLEKRLWASPALREARRQGVSYEKLRVLSRLPERDVPAWIPRARSSTCIALGRAVEGERERQMRASRTLAVALPRRVALLLGAAVRAVRERVGRPVPTGTCLALIAVHFLETWKGAARRSRSVSRKVRDRDSGWCQVPGCSRRAVHSHHVLFRSHGGSDAPANQAGTCAFHHLRCIHGGYLSVTGRAPEALVWRLGGRAWTGP